MKQDKLMLSIQIFFRFLAWSAVPFLFFWGMLTLSYFQPNSWMINQLNQLFQARHLGTTSEVIPSIFLLICFQHLKGVIINFFLYHQIATLLKKIRHESSYQGIIKHLKYISYFIIASFILNLGTFLFTENYSTQLNALLDALIQNRAIIDNYRFINVNFIDTISISIFLVIIFLIRFMEYHHKLRKDLTDLKEEQKLFG